MLLYEVDFGLSELAARIFAGQAPALGPDQVLALAAEVAGLAEGEGAVELGGDVRRLLDSSLPDDVLRTAWLAATRHRFDPAEHGTTMRAWLSTLADRWPAREAVTDDGPREAVAALIRTSTVPAPPALARVAQEADADLGFRLFLRAVKAYSLPIEKDEYDRLVALGAEFGHPGPLVHDGLDVRWPPLDTARRDALGDVGFSHLTAWFAGSWHHDATPEQVLRQAAAADHEGQTPGSQAAFLLQDTLRLLDSPLPTPALTTLWLTAADRGYNIDQLGIDGRDWLRRIAATCRDVLRAVAPDHTPPSPAVVTEPADPVLRELRGVAPRMADRSVSPHWEAIPGAEATAVLEQVVTRVDPDLGFRLLLRMLDVLSVPLTEEEYIRLQRLAAHFGHHEHLVTDPLWQRVEH
ncbi:hypothetical protein [Streptomyces sp. KAU_LT]|uniref:hypothetical protein n=1 Tax=Streptomyces sp. KAU_LT TaxID=3046669 RepID=UPI0024B8247B|nr:hypothetical protein [Streptomyces sp. KAU_LT]MDI9831099.1 hypothetical protein [Streptomyces sp. KAU_LT]